MLVQRLEDVLLEGNLKKKETKIGVGAACYECVYARVREEKRKTRKKMEKCPRSAGPASRRYPS